jgi:hypothetical protein
VRARTRARTAPGQVINKKNGALFDADDENFLSVFAKQALRPKHAVLAP